jgi:folate-binding protein YgfZ
MSERSLLHDLAARAGAAFVEDAGWLLPAHYGDLAGEYRRAVGQAAFFDVSHHGKFDLTGPEAASFLHNLCTNDVLHLSPGGGCEAFFTTAKARVVAPILVYRLPPDDGPEAFWLDVPPGLAARVADHLDHYLISEQVVIGDRTGDLVQVHLAGPLAPEVLEQALGSMPEWDRVLRLSGDGITGQVRRHEPLGLPGYDLLCPPSEAAGLWRRLTQAGARPAGLEVYNILRLEAGTPAAGADIGEDRFVVEVGRPQAICYTKGCYLGQEPIVMARDRGHVNRTLLGLRVEGDRPVPAGARVLREGNEVGQVTSSVVSPRLGTIALAYVRRGGQEPGTAVEVEAGSVRRGAEMAALPFSPGAGAGPSR